ncbi:MAG: acetyl-CoA carboxylase biotin carboxyl carrier protein subunit [Eubacteriales bacterium]|nr:acetyl-CoA carboxylase biotin carboxyl carrier protein subunit [Eubacteriales bacterium]
MELDAIFRLMDCAESSSFSKVEVQIGEVRVLLERGAAASAAATAAVPAPPAEEASETGGKDAVRSPISGVFYLAKEPGAEPFVQPGSRVNKGDILCIIEAMKTMNEICAPRVGVVSAILAKDSATVTAGDTLFLLAEGN